MGYACHTSSHPRGCAVTHWVAHGVTARCAQPVHTQAHVQGATCARVSRSRRAATRVLRCTHGVQGCTRGRALLTRAPPPQPGPFGARLAAPGAPGAGPAC